jgi:XRE family transcriptional regulator, regulator of sulfur utilization
MQSLSAEFGATVRRLREKRGLSQEKFAALAGISRTYMSEVERGVTTVSIETIAKVAAALDLSMSRLLYHMEHHD